ncbi:MAG TPA: LysR substrate-binding domain-containing protein [Candidatus Dormibacteraeota bacterium]|jgi:DNA-binding transcriptional LysR family regulator
MELRHLRYFVAVAEELHFRRAAERLHVAQPAVSEQVRRLEEELGVQLLGRRHQRVSLTPAGDVFLVEAQRVLEQADRARRAAIRTGDQARGRLRVGHLPDAVPSALPRALGRFTTTTPGVEVVLETYPSAELVERVRDRQLDAAVVCLPAPVDGLRVTVLDEEGVVVALGESHPAAGAVMIRPHQLERTPLLLMARTTNPAFFDCVITAWREAGVAAAPMEVTVPNLEHLLLAVAAGAGAALLPGSAAQRYATAGVRFVPLAPPSPTCEVVVISHPDHTGIATSAFLQLAHAESSRAGENEHSLALRGMSVGYGAAAAGS